MTRRGALVIAVSLAMWPAGGAAQNYRARVDAGAQAVSFRGLLNDSIPVALAVPAPSGGLQTPDGFAVRCGSAYCYFMRPGPELRGMPVTTSGSLVLWGLGVQGLAFHTTARLVADVGPDKVWPGTVPSFQLLEGYLEYQRSMVIARVGRQLVNTRLEPIGFDGGLLKVRWNKAALDFTGYSGWGLAQASALSVTSPALNPLDEWRPRNRQIVAGAEGAWQYRTIDARAEYRREVDPDNHYFVSERTALSLGTRVGPVRASGGVDYNIAEDVLGNADLSLTYVQPRYSVTGAVRRYQPYFSLWTLWGAFSPVPYNAVNAAAEVRATRWLSLRARGERYRYENAGISTAIVSDLRDYGWRASGGATATLSAKWTIDGEASLEYGPGASGQFADGSVTYALNEATSFDVYGGSMARPLEFRYYDATSRWIGARAARRLSTQQRVWADVAFVDDARDRPDAGASSLSQFRLRAGLSLAFGSQADRAPLPPARRTGE